MNEFTIFNNTIWFSDADSVYKHLYPEHGFEVESLGVSDRFVSEDAFIAQRNLKDEYMRRDQKHSETISELRKELKEKQDYIKTLEERIASQRTANKSIEDQKLDAQLRCGIYREDVMERDNIIKQLEAHNENQRKELASLNKVLECERKRNKELEELYSGAQKDVCMLNLKVMELNQGIRDSTDLTWKEKYDELSARYTSDSTSLNGVINELRKRLKQKDEKIEALESGIKELSDANDDLKKKIISLEDNEMYTLRLKDRCGKAERTIDVIKDALIDGDYIHHIDLRRNNK